MAAVARAAASAWVRGDMPRGFLATVSPRSCTLACGWMLFGSSVAHSSAPVNQPEQNRTNRTETDPPQPVPPIPRGPLIEGDGGRRKFHAHTSTRANKPPKRCATTATMTSQEDADLAEALALSLSFEQPPAADSSFVEGLVSVLGEQAERHIDTAVGKELSATALTKALALPTDYYVRVVAGVVCSAWRVSDSLMVGVLCQHYNCCGDSDAGWGCAYRCLQMMHSCLFQAGVARIAALAEEGKECSEPQVCGASVPTLRTIQRRLIRCGYMPKAQLGSTRYAYRHHVCLCRRPLALTSPCWRLLASAVGSSRLTSLHTSPRKRG